MNTGFNHGNHTNSAKIYQFPKGGRAALGGQRIGAKPATDQAASRTPKVSTGGSWYHEEAIAEADKNRKS